MLTCGQTSWCLTGYSHAAGLDCSTTSDLLLVSLYAH